MRLATLALVVVLNLSSATLHNVMVVGEEDCIEVGTIVQGGHCEVKSHSKDSCRVVFTLGRKRKDWLGTCLIKADTIKISDKSEIFEVEILEIEK